MGQRRLTFRKGQKKPSEAQTDRQKLTCCCSRGLNPPKQHLYQNRDKLVKGFENYFYRDVQGFLFKFSMNWKSGIFIIKQSPGWKKQAIYSRVGGGRVLRRQRLLQVKKGKFLMKGENYLKAARKFFEQVRSARKREAGNYLRRPVLVIGGEVPPEG